LWRLAGSRRSKWARNAGRSAAYSLRIVQDGLENVSIVVLSVVDVASTPEGAVSLDPAHIVQRSMKFKRPDTAPIWRATPVCDQLARKIDMPDRGHGATMSDYILHCFGQSGNAYKVALMLNLCGCDWQPRFVDFFNGETRSPAFRDSCNEMGEVPVLEHGGQRLTQSGAILSLLSERHGRFGGHDAEERYDILRWILFDNHKFTSYFATLRFMVGLKKMDESPVTEFLRA